MTFCSISCFGEFFELESVGDVLRHGHVRPNGVALKDHRHVAPLGRHQMTSEMKSTLPSTRISPRIRLQKTGEQTQASWSCRNRTDRAARRIRRRRFPSRESSTAAASVNFFVSPRIETIAMDYSRVATTSRPGKPLHCQESPRRKPPTREFPRPRSLRLGLLL